MKDNSQKLASYELKSKTVDVKKNLHLVRSRITAATSNRSGTCQSPDVSLVAVSKRQPDSCIDAALMAGQRVFGENRVQEASERWSTRRKNYADLIIHLIGPLQTNKVAEAVALFDVIEVVDREKLASALAKEIANQNRKLQCYIQVNTGKKKKKSGIMPNQLNDFIMFCKTDLALSISGLMCIPPVDEEAAMHFALLNTMAKRHNLFYLSMGMSGDYEDAIAFGATSVRVGSAIFGERLN